MPAACNTVKDASNGLLMATHQLKQQPFSNKVRYNLVDSARNILEGTMKVLHVHCAVIPALHKYYKIDKKCNILKNKQHHTGKNLSKSNPCFESLRAGRTVNLQKILDRNFHDPVRFCA